MRAAAIVARIARPAALPICWLATKSEPAIPAFWGATPFVSATDAAGNEEFRDTSQVYCLPGSEAVATTVGILLGGIPVNYMPTPVPITDANAGLGDASVLVMLGKDLVNTVPAGLAHG